MAPQLRYPTPFSLDPCGESRCEALDFHFDAEDEAFRHEVRAFLSRELSPDWVGHVGELQPEDFELDLTIRRKLADRGWLALAWPKDYGGGGANVLRQMIYNEEMTYARSPGRDYQGVGMIGPSIMVNGTDVQKAEHLGRIARGQVIWCQGFSEPGSGSDLASLQTRAVREGDDFVINGQKVWTSSAHRAQWCHILTRTDSDAPKHRGITYFLLDMNTPGIEVRPLINMADGHGFNEVYFNDVRVPARNMLGEENRGWYAATTTLDFERSSVGLSAGVRRMLDDAIAFFRDLRSTRQTPIDNPVMQHKLAELVIQTQVSRLHSYGIAWRQFNGELPNKEASMAKLFGSELSQRVAAVLMEALGPYGVLRQDSRRAPMTGLVWKSYLSSRSSTIAAGTSEIQRNIIATRGLGLPR